MFCFDQKYFSLFYLKYLHFKWFKMRTKLHTPPTVSNHGRVLFFPQSRKPLGNLNLEEKSFKNASSHFPQRIERFSQASSLASSTRSRASSFNCIITRSSFISSRSLAYFLPSLHSFLCRVSVCPPPPPNPFSFQLSWPSQQAPKRGWDFRKVISWREYCRLFVRACLFTAIFTFFLSCFRDDFRFSRAFYIRLRFPPRNWNGLLLSAKYIQYMENLPLGGNWGKISSRSRIGFFPCFAVCEE